MFARFSRSTRRFALLVSVLPAAVLVFGALYWLGMNYLEEAPRSFLESLQWASETLTTTGYGNDSHWTHPAVALFVIFGQFVGQFLIFLIFPIFLLPYFEERFEVRLQHALPAMAGKVLFYRYGPALEWVLEDMRRAGAGFVIFEEDLQIARVLRDRQYDVVFGKLADDPAALARVREARAVVSNAGDHANATCAMVVREHGFTGPLYALADEPLYRAPMLQIGATDVFTPAHVLGGALASHASVRISPPAEGVHLLGTQAGLVEFRVSPHSPLAGKTLGELQLRERYGVSVIGQWHAGSFVAAHGPEMVVQAGGRLVVVGAHDRLTGVERLAMPIRRSGPIVIAGYGTVGQKVAEMLRDAGETCIVIDSLGQPGVDVVGNVLQTASLEQARVREAAAVVLALSNDGECVFATAVVREFAPGVPLIVRVGRTANIERLYRAGADFAVSLGQVAGQILAFHLIGEQAVPADVRLRIARHTAGSLAGTHPWRGEALERTGAKIVAVEREGQVSVEFADDYRLRGDDTLFVCGSLDSLERFQRQFGSAAVVIRR